MNKGANKNIQTDKILRGKINTKINRKEHAKIDKEYKEDKENGKWDSLGITNDFLFGKLMRNPKLCKKLLERIFPDIEIDHVEYPEAEKTIKSDVDAKSVRLDIYIKDDKETVYNIEMQVADTKELPKRSRYYQSMLDLQQLDRGESYKRLKKSYIIFICPFDAYQERRHMYTFENICREDSKISLGDETTKIFLNADSEMDDVSRELRAFLDYVAGRKTNDAYVEELEDALRKAKKSREWRHEYMTLLMRDQENIEKGIEKGIEQGKLLMIENALKTTGSIQQTSMILQLSEEEVQEVAKEKGILCHP